MWGYPVRVADLSRRGKRCASRCLHRFPLGLWGRQPVESVVEWHGEGSSLVAPLAYPLGFLPPPPVRYYAVPD